MIKIVLIFIIFFISACNKQPIVKENIQTETIEEINKSNKVKIQSLYFKDNQFNIGSKQFSIVLKNAKIIKEIVKEPNKIVNILSYTNRDIIDEYSYSLAIKQALSIQKLFISHGVPKDKIFIISLASLSEYSIDQEFNYTSRIEFKILDLSNKE